jgi:arabinose-5-phosphate isomerase
MPISETSNPYPGAVEGTARPGQSANSGLSASLAEGRRVMLSEAKAITAAAQRLGFEFETAIELLFDCRGKVIVTGMGKSGHIASKIAATFASTGTPAFFVHPAELRHGDFGILEQRDLVVAISSSGVTDEIRLALDPIKRLGCKLIAMTGSKESSLSTIADVSLDIAVEEEACALNLAPTNSTTVTLALGDALAIALMVRKNFKVEDYARSHPGGSLGRKLVTVENIMRTAFDLPTVREKTIYADVIAEIDLRRLGFTAVCNEADQLIGIVTDGDTRRAQVKFGAQAFNKTAAEIMTSDPRTISVQCLASEALQIMDKHAISDLLIVNEKNQPIGVVRLKDLLAAGVI